MADTRTFQRLSGQDLAALRREAGLTQKELAERAGIGRQAVIYWEKSATVTPWGRAPRRLFEVLGIAVVPPTVSYSETITRARGDGVLLETDPYTAKLLAQATARWVAKALSRAAQRRVYCGATTRKGYPCQLLSELGRDRCKFHGGCSTGPMPSGGGHIINASRRCRCSSSPRCR